MPLLFKPANADADLSAWMDGAAATDCNATDGDAAYWASEAGRATWHTYHLIGDVLRTPDLAIAATPAFAAKLADALAAEPAHRAPSATPAIPRQTTHFVWPGLALAAALALVVWVARPYLFDADPATDTGTVLAAEESPSAPVAGLHDYVDAHRQMAGAGLMQPVSFGAARVRTGASR